MGSASKLISEIWLLITNPQSDQAKVEIDKASDIE